MKDGNGLKNENVNVRQDAEVINNIGQVNFYSFNAKGLLPYKYSPYLSKINSLYEENIEFFSESEISQMNSILQIIKYDSAPFVLLTGNPASGKSVLAYKIATDIESCGKNYKAYYYTCKEGIAPTDLINDLKFYNQIDQENKLYIIDDIHLSPSRIFYFFKRVKNENIKCAILFVSRMTKDFKEDKFINEGIYEELKSVTFQLEFSSYGTTDYKVLNTNEKVKANLKSMNKIEGIVQKFSQKYNLHQPTNEVVSGLFKKTGFDLLNLFYYLSVWKEKSDTISDIELQLIDESDVLKHVYTQNLSLKEPKEREIIIKYACMYQYEAWFEVQFDDYSIIKSLLEDGLVIRDNKVYSFYHSKFAELIIRSYIHCDEFYDIRYKNLLDLVITNIKDYIKSYLYNRVRNYPNNIFELFDGMLGGRNRYLQNSKEDNGKIFKELLNDNEIKNITLEFFYSNSIEAIKIKKFRDYVFKYANELYRDFEVNLIYKDNYNWLKERIMNVPSADNFLAFVLFINEYKEFYYSFSNSEIRQLIFDADFNAIKNLYNIDDIFFRKNVKNLLTDEEWFMTFKDSNIDKMRDTLIFVEKMDNDFASFLIKQISDEDLIKKIQENFVIGLAYTIPVMLKLDKERINNIIVKFDADYIVKNIVGYMKSHHEEASLQVFSDFIQKLYIIDAEKAILLFSKIYLDEIDDMFNLYSVPQIISFISEIKEINEELAVYLFSSINYEILCEKLMKEPANKILNSISEIRHLDENRAKELMFVSKEILIKNIPEIKLETFLSYEKKGILVVEKEITSEIMGRIPDSYIRNFYKLKDMRDITSLLSLYRYLDFNIWDKRYLVDEILEYVDQNFEKKYLHKKWLHSTLLLLEACSLLGRKIKSVGSKESKETLKRIILEKGNLKHFVENITIIKKHDKILADELQFELSCMFDTVEKEMKGVSFFMDTILMEILKFVGASIGSGVTWDFLKKSSNNIIERFKKKFVQENFFDNDTLCEEFFYKLCVNSSNNDEEPFDDVKTLYKKYAKGKQYEPFEQSFKEWLKKNASDILMSNKDNAGISVFKDSIVEQRAQTINNIGVQNKY